MAEDVAILPAPVGVPAALRGARALCERHGLTLVVLGAWATQLARLMPHLFVSDSWLSLVDGRYVAQHGLPHRDTLTTWTVGHHWVDQQWGAQLVLYGLERAGGLALLAVLAVVLALGTLALAAVVAVRAGGSPRGVALAVAVPLAGAPWMVQIRSQTLVLPLFVLVYGLVVSDARRPSRRVLLVLPVLAVWANLHGSVALAACFVAGYGASLVVRRRIATGLALLVAPLALLVTPYGADIVGYYRLMLVAPPFASVVQEWQPMHVSPGTAVFFVAAFATVALLGRARRAVTGFEQVALLVLLAAGLDAARNATWFVLALAVSLPRLVDAVRPTVPPTEAVRRVNRVLGPAVALVGALAILAGVGKGFDGVTGTSSEAASISRAAGAHGVVLADDAHADWLLWARPELAGRVAYDVRFELFDAAQISALVGLDRGLAAPWARCGPGMAVVTYGSSAQRRAFISQHVLARGASGLFAGRSFGAFRQSTTATPCSL